MGNSSKWRSVQRPETLPLPAELPRGCLLGNTARIPGPTRALDLGYTPSACPLVADYQPLAVAAVEHVQQVVYLALGHQAAKEPYRKHLPRSFRNALLVSSEALLGGGILPPPTSFPSH
jgi:hypothetical protein